MWLTRLDRKRNSNFETGKYITLKQAEGMWRILYKQRHGHQTRAACDKFYRPQLWL